MGNVGRFALSIGAAALFAGCGGSQPPIGAPGALPAMAQRPLARVAYRVLHSFGSGTDGSSPQASLLYKDGMLYGTTAAGGGGYCGFGGSYCGTVFSLTLNGAEKVLHSFGRGKDGWLVQAGLVRVNGKFYGTTANSQAYCGSKDGHRIFCNGTVFSISKTGVEKVLQNFGNKPGDAASPWAPLVYAGGLLYGTTAGGGASGADGTAFSVTTSGKTKVLHSFCTGADGCGPVAGLIDVNGTLYGTTPRGGRYGVAHNGNDGTVFSITTTGKARTLHNFGKGYDGYSPKASLIDLTGTLYGTTAYGGTYGSGTVFSITTSGKYKIVYSFGRPGSPCCDGQNPWAGLINVNGTL
ncbi:MAG: choice-of-anchor tandem repeat GloVer-containing protein, partial [Candidatus Cybelea sp.]